MLAKRCAALLLALAALLLLEACWVYSANPLAETEADIVFDRNLLGSWVQEDGCVLTVSRLANEKSYRVAYAVPRDTKGNNCFLKPGQSASFLGSLVDLNGVRFLDLYPADREPMHHMMNLHSFYRITLSGRTLSIIPMNEDWVKAQIASGTSVLAARQQQGEEDDDLILTSSTHELRSFLASNSSSDQLFSEAHKIVFQRKLQP